MQYTVEGYYDISLEDYSGYTRDVSFKIRGWRGENEKEYTNRILEEFKYRSAKNANLKRRICVIFAT